MFNLMFIVLFSASIKFLLHALMFNKIYISHTVHWHSVSIHSQSEVFLVLSII